MTQRTGCARCAQSSGDGPPRHPGVDMQTFSRAMLAGPLFLLALMLASLPVSAQVIMELSGEYERHNDRGERPGGDPPGDYLGIPLNDMGRMRANTSNPTDGDCRSSSAVRIPPPTSGAPMETSGSSRRSIPYRGNSPRTTFNGCAPSTGPFTWMDDRIPRNGRLTPGRVFQPEDGKEIRWSSRRRTSRRATFAVTTFLSATVPG